jgi:hypothetical protein
MDDIGKYTVFILYAGDPCHAQVREGIQDIFGILEPVMRSEVHILMNEGNVLTVGSSGTAVQCGGSGTELPLSVIDQNHLIFHTLVFKPFKETFV